MVINLVLVIAVTPSVLRMAILYCIDCMVMCYESILCWCVFSMPYLCCTTCMCVVKCFGIKFALMCLCSSLVLPVFLPFVGSLDVPSGCQELTFGCTTLESSINFLITEFVCCDGSHCWPHPAWAMCSSKFCYCKSGNFHVETFHLLNFCPFYLLQLCTAYQ